MRPETKARLRAALRALRLPASLGVGYLLLRALFVALAAGQGLITPDASVDVPLAALGAAVLGLRLVALFVLPPLVLYRLIVALALPVARQADSDRVTPG
jgi:hypothetical protein